MVFNVIGSQFSVQTCRASVIIMFSRLQIIQYAILALLEFQNMSPMDGYCHLSQMRLTELVFINRVALFEIKAHGRWAC